MCTKTILGTGDIELLIPHRRPALLLDNAEVTVEVATSTWISSGVPGHFPDRPIIPGMLTTEAMAQLAAVLFFWQHRDLVGKKFGFVGVDSLRFHEPIIPGEQVTLTATPEKISLGLGFGRFKCTATVLRLNGESSQPKLAADGIFLAAFLKD